MQEPELDQDELKELVEAWVNMSELHYEKKELNDAIKTKGLNIPKEEIRGIQKDIQMSWNVMQNSVERIKELLPDTEVSVPFIRRLAVKMGLMTSPPPPVTQSNSVGVRSEPNESMRAAFESARAEKDKAGIKNG